VSYIYGDILSVAVTSIRVKILDVISQSNEGINREDLLEIYNSKIVIETRLQRLIQNGQLREESGNIFIGNKNRQLLLAKFYLFFWKIVLVTTELPS